MVNRNFGAPLIMTFHSGVHATNSESTYLELNKRTQFSRSETENSEFPSQSKSTQSSSLNSELVEPPY